MNKSDYLSGTALLNYSLGLIPILFICTYKNFSYDNILFFFDIIVALLFVTNVIFFFVELKKKIKIVMSNDIHQELNNVNTDKVNLIGIIVLFILFLVGIFLVFYYPKLSMYLCSSTIIGLTWIIGFIVTIFYITRGSKNA